MNSINVLIVEDELLIAETIKLYVEERGHRSVGIAISYDEAVSAIQKDKPDIVLLDIRLYGEKSGIDVALYIQNLERHLPYIIVSSQFDQGYIEKAMQVGASGYITKPISKETLWTSLELAMLKSDELKKERYIDLKISHGLQRVKISDILYIKSDHVYVEIIGASFMYYGRYTLADMLKLLDSDHFIQIHRSYIINSSRVEKYTSTKVWINNVDIPISSKYKKLVLSKLK